MKSCLVLSAEGSSMFDGSGGDPGGPRPGGRVLAGGPAGHLSLGKMGHALFCSQSPGYSGLLFLSARVRG